VQEPYTILNNVAAGFPKGFRISAHGSGRKRSTIIVNNVDVIAITQVSQEKAILKKSDRRASHSMEPVYTSLLTMI
jgi:hypothetical protein